MALWHSFSLIYYDVNIIAIKFAKRYFLGTQATSQRTEEKNGGNENFVLLLPHGALNWSSSINIVFWSEAEENLIVQKSQASTAAAAAVLADKAIYIAVQCTQFHSGKNMQDVSSVVCTHVII